MTMIAALLLLAAIAASPPFPTKAGQCGWTAGRFAVYNGSSVNRLTVSGTHHILALRDADKDVPASIKRYWAVGPSDRRLAGYFRVCARERYIAGRMQHVRILATRRTYLSD